MPVETLLQTFNAAFADYEVWITLTLENLTDMMRARDLTLDRSVGIFDGAKLASFILCGYRSVDGEGCYYDGGTGTIIEYRRRGLGSKLLAAHMETIARTGAKKFILEVLENNRPAIELYKKHGFEITRKLSCHQIDKTALAKPGHSEATVLTAGSDISLFAGIDCSKYSDFRHSWQNEKRSVLNTIEKYEFVSLFDGKTLAAYGLVDRKNGSVPQLGVAPQWKGRGVERAVLSGLAEKTAADKLRLMNIPEGEYLSSALAECGFTVFISQYEMEHSF